MNESILFSFHQHLLWMKMWLIIKVKPRPFVSVETSKKLISFVIQSEKIKNMYKRGGGVKIETLKKAIKFQLHEIFNSC